LDARPTGKAPPVTVTVASSRLEAQISERGAELTRLRDHEGRDLLWNGDPAYWSGRSPLLFPIVGSLRGDRVRIGGTDHILPSHGFARTSLFQLLDAAPEFCRYRMVASKETLKAYPFAFQLDVSYRVVEAALVVTAAVTNAGSAVMPFSFGFHPAFRWPLPYGGDRDDHVIAFEKDEPEPTRLLDGNLLGKPAPHSPVDGKRLMLRDSLFEKGALVFDKAASRRVVYGVPGRPGIAVAFPDMPHLGIWTKPGAGFVCIEPWQGHASPVEFDGELSAKPGVLSLPPGETRRFVMEISVTQS
jgi:galactose mutarotase-like enzyme